MSKAKKGKAKAKVSKAKEPEDSKDVPIEDEATDEEPSLEQKLEQAQAEAAKNYDLALRTKAEMENLRRRTTKDIEHAHKFALERFAKELLDVADSIDLGLNAIDENTNVNTLQEGMQLTHKQLYKVLEKFNIELIDADGAKFDPEVHEAMTMVPNPDVKPNTVIEVVQKGYTLNDRLLRAAKVIVSQ